LAARHTRSGVQGIGTSLTPRGRSASTIAFTTAGVDAIVPASTDALDAERVPGRRGLGAVGDDARQIGRAGQKVLGERPGDEVAALVVHGLLVQSLGDALRHPTVHLTLDDQRD
jgi:hypothetical protein